MKISRKCGKQPKKQHKQQKTVKRNAQKQLYAKQSTTRVKNQYGKVKKRKKRQENSGKQRKRKEIKENLL